MSSRVVANDGPDPVVGRLDRGAERLERVTVAAGVLDVDELLDGGGAGDLAGGVPSHAVGHSEQPRSGVAGVLVALADQADVGPRDVPEHQGHRAWPTSGAPG